MTQASPGNPEILEALRNLTSAVEGFNARLDKAEEDYENRRKRLAAAEVLAASADSGQRWNRHLLGVLALVVAVVVAGFAVWNHHQDDARARNHEATQARIAALERQLSAQARANTLFRMGACVEAEDWQVYLDANPGSTPASRAAAHRIAVMAVGLCSPPKR